MNDILNVLILCIVCFVMTIIQFRISKKGGNNNDKSSKKGK